jgi:putative sterol carrier protein
MAPAGTIQKETATDPVESFFAQLAERGHEPLLARGSGTVRFDLAEGKKVEHWLVAIEKGDVTVSHRNAAADTILRVDRSLFEQMVTGKVNATAAVLRGLLETEGNLGLVVLFQRLFPGPPRSRAKRTATQGRGGR